MHPRRLVASRAGYLLGHHSPENRESSVRVALVSEHASPLAAIGGVDAGGQNVHVAELAAGLVRFGHSVAVYTRRDDPELAERLTTSAGYEVIHVSAGPPAPLSKDELWPHMGAFADCLTEMLKFSAPIWCMRTSVCRPGHPQRPLLASAFRC